MIEVYRRRDFRFLYNSESTEKIGSRSWHGYEADESMNKKVIIVNDISNLYDSEFQALVNY